MSGRRTHDAAGATRARGERTHAAGQERGYEDRWFGLCDEAGFSMLEAVLAMVILAVVGLALHQATMAGVRHMQRGKVQSNQAKKLEYAIDLVRAEACFLSDELMTVDDEHALELTDGTEVIVRRLDDDPADPEKIRTVEITLPTMETAPSVSHVLLLDVGRCE